MGWGDEGINTEEKEDLQVKELEKDREREERDEERRKKAAKLSRGWELFRVCKEIIEEEGMNWKASKERRDKERMEEEEKAERIARAARKQESWKTEKPGPLVRPNRNLDR